MVALSCVTRHKPSPTYPRPRPRRAAPLPLRSLTDSKGRTVDFKNTLIILTSNVGSSVIEKGGGGIGFQLVRGAGRG